MLYFHAAQAPLDALLRDFANPRANDDYLPFVRNKDWYDGHSWASGVVPFAAGKNQVYPLALCRHIARTVLRCDPRYIAGRPGNTIILQVRFCPTKNRGL